MTAIYLHIHLVHYVLKLRFPVKLPYPRLYKKTRETLLLNNQFNTIIFQA